MKLLDLADGVLFDVESGQPIPLKEVGMEIVTSTSKQGLGEAIRQRCFKLGATHVHVGVPMEGVRAIAFYPGPQYLYRCPVTFYVKGDGSNKYQSHFAALVPNAIERVAFATNDELIQFWSPEMEDGWYVTTYSELSDTYGETKIDQIVADIVNKGYYKLVKEPSVETT